MLGKIVHIEHRIGWIAIRDDHGEITIAELLGGYSVEKGNVISGDLHTCGGSTFYNRSTGEELSVMVEYVGLNDQQAVAAIQRCG
ncbi:hypothetical protein Q0A17_06390 [Citrobacter sp. S2-9]|uniref:Uncharacterized protein n=1 Tax=Citrobacter enshiensis TaxID=2971264 RepID=A0ABT8PSM1_9ENTR|nr:hypothetical protein [Citrobacter enshiensis]MDN8599043.1 hypothetical protein [Citrobacter enshiensis]